MILILPFTYSVYDFTFRISDGYIELKKINVYLSTHLTVNIN